MEVESVKPIKEYKEEHHINDNMTGENKVKTEPNQFNLIQMKTQHSG